MESDAGFWLHRRLDGAEPLFVEALEKLLRAYDAQWLTSFRLPRQGP
jgi:hypothetical protein